MTKTRPEIDDEGETLLLRPLWRDEPADADGAVPSSRLVLLCGFPAALADSLRRALGEVPCRVVGAASAESGSDPVDLAQAVLTMARELLLAEVRRRPALVQLVAPVAPSEALSVALSALAGTLAQETSSPVFQSVAVDPADDPAVLALLGRSPEGDSARRVLAELEKAGARASYHPVDVADAPALAALIAALRAEHGAIDGVLHTAGIHRDALLIRKDIADSAEILSPKIAGTLALDAATATDALDFFVCFASLAGLTGNLGQADYAMGNGFLDGFAAWRNRRVARGERAGRTVSIDWPLWAEGGMTMPTEMIALVRDRFGLTAPPTQDGIDALACALASGEDQVAVAHGLRDRILERMDGGILAASASPAPVAATESVEAVLLELVARELHLDEAEVDRDQPLGEFGFDSISLSVLAADLGKALGREVSPAVLFAQPTLAALARHLAAEGGAPSAPPAPPVRAVAASAPPAPAVSVAAPVRPAGGDAGDDAVAIVGVSCAFPGARDIDAFWSNLLAGRDAISEVPPDRWDWREIWGDPVDRPGCTDVKWGGFLDGVAEFDPRFFGLSSRDAESRPDDPQRRPQPGQLFPRPARSQRDDRYRLFQRSGGGASGGGGDPPGRGDPGHRRRRQSDADADGARRVVARRNAQPPGPLPHLHVRRRRLRARRRGWGPGAEAAVRRPGRRRPHPCGDPGQRRQSRQARPIADRAEFRRPGRSADRRLSPRRDRSALRDLPRGARHRNRPWRSGGNRRTDRRVPAALPGLGRAAADGSVLRSGVGQDPYRPSGSGGGNLLAGQGAVADAPPHPDRQPARRPDQSPHRPDRYAVRGGAGQPALDGGAGRNRAGSAAPRRNQFVRLWRGQRPRRGGGISAVAAGCRRRRSPGGAAAVGPRRGPSGRILPRSAGLDVPPSRRRRAWGW